MKSVLSVFLCAVLMFVTVACEAPKTSEVIVALNAVADATSVSVVVASSLVAMGKVDPEVAEQVRAYSESVGVAVRTSITELNGNATNPEKIAAITTAFAKVATPALGEQSPQVAAAIDAVSAAIKVFLNRLNNSGVLRAAASAPKAKIKLSSSDKALIKNIEKKMAETKILANTVQ